MPGENIQDWSTTAATNATADSSINWAEGQTRASVNNSARSMMAAIAKDRNLRNGSITTGGTANAQTFSSGLSYTSVPTGLRVRLKIGTSLTNTATTTLNMDGIGGVTIKNQYGNSLAPSELRAGAYADLLYDGTNWKLLDTPSGLVLVSRATASASSSIDFNLPISYSSYKVIYTGFIPSVDESQLNLTFSTDSGSTFKTTGYRHVYLLDYGDTGNTAATFFSTGGSTSNIPASAIADTNSLRPMAGEIDFYGFGLGTASPGMVIGKFIGYSLTSASGTGTQFYSWMSTNPDFFTGYDAIRFAMSSGTITSGTFSLYGYL